MGFHSIHYFFAHVQLYSYSSDTMYWCLCLKDMENMLREHSDIVDSTLQFELEDFLKNPWIF